MKIPSLSKIDEIRKKGFRPQAVGCFFNEKEKKVFLFFDEKYKIWQFPQGGIENNEKALIALEREMTEELGEEFVKKADIINSQIIAQKAIRFPPNNHDSRNLINDKNEYVKMIGKWYYFFLIKTEEVSFEKYIKHSEFHNWKLLNYHQARQVAQTIYQGGKKRITMDILNILRKNRSIE